MGGRMRRALVAVGCALGLGVVSVASAGSASAVATTTVGLWRMDEAPGAPVAVDRSGTGLHGAIGADVRTGVVHDGATAYRFPAIAPNSGPARPEHLVTVPHSTRLNPGSGDFSVTVRFRTTTSPSNIVQKGQSGVAGGF